MDPAKKPYKKPTLKNYGPHEKVVQAKVKTTKESGTTAGGSKS